MPSIACPSATGLYTDVPVPEETTRTGWSRWNGTTEYKV